MGGKIGRKFWLWKVWWLGKLVVSVWVVVLGCWGMWLVKVWLVVLAWVCIWVCVAVYLGLVLVLVWR
jgi:hypothetical protein